jgi:glycosyltransferase involved in cell wall biosynthesis
MIEEMDLGETRLRASVVIVTRDRPELLANLLRSLTRQTLPPDEVVVVDNNSRKSYQAVFQEFERLLPLRMVVEEVVGIPFVRNRGIREAGGDIILFTDDDCEADPAWVESMVRPFYQSPHIGAVGGEILSVKRAGTLVEEFCVAESLMRVGRDEGAG